jgi:hypothetical protein
MALLDNLFRAFARAQAEEQIKRTRALLVLMPLTNDPAHRPNTDGEHR